MWKVEEGDYRDDITVIVLMLPWVTGEMRTMVADEMAKAGLGGSSSAATPAAAAPGAASASPSA